MYATIYGVLVHGTPKNLASLQSALEKHDIVARTATARIREAAAWLRYHEGLEHGAFARPNVGDAVRCRNLGMLATQEEIDRAGVKAANRGQELEMLENKCRSLVRGMAHVSGCDCPEKAPTVFQNWVDQTLDTFFRR